MASESIPSINISHQVGDTTITLTRSPKGELGEKIDYQINKDTDLSISHAADGKISANLNIKF